ncbi:FMN-binding domain protein [Halalkaliarchaeum desulfuricum]|uniref:FMN-binding domain protein n=1 Tax=Halalkaliarchaeum desulfuricum TaxID=2055893 RepID=A0A343TIE6_9EURY|nr:pyridoxamine 5'-phosphate oxidase family protein [Halalkaliarchaeum desulfuricum]AUX08868.1 FMN-binding domain protein [Halalkaliarchaeum desulfuricum]
MENVNYVYTAGMDEEDVEYHLRSGEHGVLGLADGDDAYAIPLSYHYDGDRFLLRVGESGVDDSEEGEKMRFLETTDTATFVCYDASSEESWSILVRGSLHEWQTELDDATINEWFQPFRLFAEVVEDIQFTIYELRMVEVVGRMTIE